MSDNQIHGLAYYSQLSCQDSTSNLSTPSTLSSIKVNMLNLFATSAKLVGQNTHLMTYHTDYLHNTCDRYTHIPTN